MSSIQLLDSPGANSVGVIDFSGAAAAGEVITIGGVDYSEADSEDLAAGVWTNGASASDSATSLKDAIEGDTREDRPEITAIVSTEGNSVVLMHDYAGTQGDLAVSASDGTNVTVEDMHDGEDAQRKHVATAHYTVTSQDVLANEINIPLPFAPNGFAVQVTTSSGAIDHAVDSVFTIETGPDRIKGELSGSTDLTSGDVVSVVAFE